MSVVLVQEPYFCVFLVSLHNIYTYAQDILSFFVSVASLCGSVSEFSHSFTVPQKKTLAELSEMYKELSTKIFTQSAFWGTSNLVWSHSYYDTEMWEQLLKMYVGETSLIRTARDPLMPKVRGSIWLKYLSMLLIILCGLLGL